MMKKVWLIGAVILCLTLLTNCSLQNLASEPDSGEQEDSLFNDMEMDHPAKKETAVRPASVDIALKQQFKKDYHATEFRQRRQVFEKYLITLGAQGILDFLEATHPRCHGQAHLFGQALFAYVNDLDLALKECGTRCTGGCMHGILKEAFGGNLHDNVTKEIVNICDKGEIVKIYKPGNCAHGVGHTLMVILGYDLGKALSACTSFSNQGMGYYCATGVYMEYFTSRKKREEGVKSQPSRLHFPCDTYTRYPAACYRYQSLFIFRTLGKDWTRVAEECIKLTRLQRRGCFHGLGKLKIKSIVDNPSLLSDVCGRGTPEDQIMCIEGAIEKLADYNEPRALTACASLDGNNTVVCRMAAKDKMYEIKKNTMALYYEE